jgi:hypothetical protein
MRLAACRLQPANLPSYGLLAETASRIKEGYGVDSFIAQKRWNNEKSRRLGTSQAGTAKITACSW